MHSLCVEMADVHTNATIQTCRVAHERGSLGGISELYAFLSLRLSQIRNTAPTMATRMLPIRPSP